MRDVERRAKALKAVSEGRKPNRRQLRFDKKRWRMTCNEPGKPRHPPRLHARGDGEGKAAAQGDVAEKGPCRSCPRPRRLQAG